MVRKEKWINELNWMFWGNVFFKFNSIFLKITLIIIRKKWAEHIHLNSKNIWTNDCHVSILLKFLFQIKFWQKILIISVKLNGNRQVSGILRGFDPFMNLVIDEAVEINKRNQQIPIGMVVIRGNAVVLLESLDRI